MARTQIRGGHLQNRGDGQRGGRGGRGTTQNRGERTLETQREWFQNGEVPK